MTKFELKTKKGYELAILGDFSPRDFHPLDFDTADRVETKYELKARPGHV